MGYRENFFKVNTGKRRPFRRGLWWRCVSCGKWFRKEEITVDHRISKRRGGTDDVWNLQAMCRSCNSSKRDRSSGVETASTLLRATVHGDLGKAVGGIAKQKVKDLAGIKYERK